MGFSAEWLALREPLDARSRDAGLLARAAAVAQGGVVMDMGCGTGALRRAMTHLVPDGRWRMLDADASLLADAGGEPVCADLGDLNALPLDGVSLVASSALLDLMPLDWIKRLAAQITGRPFYAALIYDGRMSFDPPHPADAAVTEAFNRHQRGDKGLGAAMGPDAAMRTAEVFSAQCYAVTMAASPWIIGPGEATLREALLDGIADAAGEAGYPEASSWRAVPRQGCLIGHSDLLALPR